MILFNTFYHHLPGGTIKKTWQTKWSG